ncbi:MAG: hypothetical protein AAGG55_11825 [Pseudomonadota bacterium]
MSRLLLLLSLFCAHAVSPSWGASEPFGLRVDFGSMEDLQGGTPAADSELSPQELRGQIAVLEERLAEERYGSGPFGLGMSETLNDLARSYKALGRTGEALGAWQEALYLVRVNEGLYAPAQRPLVRQILETLREAKDYSALDNRYDYFFRLYGAGQPPLTDVRLGALREYLRWQREAVLRRLDGIAKTRLLRIYNLSYDTWELVSGDSGSSWQLIVAAGEEMMSALHLIELLVDPPERIDVRREEFRVTQDNPLDFDLEQERLDNIQRTLRRRGREVLETMEAVIPVTETEAWARVKLSQADWLMWLGASREARGRYEDLWTDLRKQGAGELANTWFADPTPLPDNDVFRYPGRQPVAIVPALVETSPTGRGRATTPTEQAYATRVRRTLNGIRYRPAIVDGEALDAQLGPENFSYFER